MQNIVTSRSKMTSSQNSVSTRSFRNLLIGISSQRSEKACQVSKIGEGGCRKTDDLCQYLQRLEEKRYC